MTQRRWLRREILEQHAESQKNRVVQYAGSDARDPVTVDAYLTSER